MLGTWKSGGQLITISKSGNGFTMADGGAVIPVQIVHNPDGTFNVTMDGSGIKNTTTVTVVGNTLTAMGTTFTKVTGGSTNAQAASKFEFEELLGRWKSGDKVLEIERSGNNVNVTTTGMSAFSVQRNPDGSFTATPSMSDDTAPYAIRIEGNTLKIAGDTFTKV